MIRTISPSAVVFTLALAGFVRGASAQTAEVSAVSSVAAWTPRAPGSAPGWSVNTYLYDDGASENAVKIWSGAGTWGTTCWIQGYDAVSGSDTITSILVAFGSGLFPANQPALGDATNVAIWSDPNQDLSPVDAVLLVQVADVVTVLGDTFQQIAVPPTAVTGSFFVGAFMANGHTPNVYPAAIDNTTASNGRSWLAGAGGSTVAPAPFDPTNLAGAGFPVQALQIYFAGVYLLRAEGGSPATVYCTAKVNSLGCTPAIGSAGTPSATLGFGFTVTCGNVRNNKNGLLFYKCNGSQNGQPFQGGTLCVGPSMIKRAPVQSSGGNPAPANDCSGAYSTDMNAFAFFPGPPVPDPALQIQGTVVHTQQWGRDPGFAAPNNTTLSDGLEYTVGP